MIGCEAVLVMAILSVLVVGGEIGAIGVTRTASRSICPGVGSAEPGSAAAALP